MSLHLHAVPDDVAPATAISMDAVFFVIQRQNGHWSPAAKIIAVFNKEEEAETHAAALKADHPQQTFGVAALRSEARTVLKPIEIVRVPLSPEQQVGA